MKDGMQSCSGIQTMIATTVMQIRCKSYGNKVQRPPNSVLNMQGYGASIIVW